MQKKLTTIMLTAIILMAFPPLVNYFLSADTSISWMDVSVYIINAFIQGVIWILRAQIVQRMYKAEEKLEFWAKDKGHSVRLVPDKEHGLRVEDDWGNGYAFAKEPVEVKQNLWIIWSIEHNAWWAPNHRGYSKEKRNAGTYTFEEACKIIEGANIGNHDVPNEAMILFKGNDETL